MRLLRLAPAVQRRVAAGVLSAGHARALLALNEPEEQERLAARVVMEGISVRGLEELVAVGRSATSSRPHHSRPASKQLAEVAARLSDRFETRCQVDARQAQGKITIEFASLEDLQRILDLM